MPVPQRGKRGRIAERRFPGARAGTLLPVHLSAQRNLECALGLALLALPFALRFDAGPFAACAVLGAITAVDDPDDVAAAWEEALACDRPVVYEAVVDPEVPPLPPHVTMKQARALASAVAGGDRASRRFVRQSVRQRMAGLLPR